MSTAPSGGSGDAPQQTRPPSQRPDQGGSGGGVDGGPGGGSGKRPAETDPEVLRRYSRSTGWLVLALVLAFIGLQVPLPWRLLTLAAGLAGVVGGVVLLVLAIRRRLPATIHISAVVSILACGLFTLTGAAQAVFWEATASYDECRVEALTQRSMDQCQSAYEEDMLSMIPGMPR